MARLVAAHRPRRVLARFDTGEHARFGSDQVVFQRGDIEITESEMIAMGDLYERVEEMYQADDEELRRLVALVRRDKEHYTGKPGVEDVSNKEWIEATPVGPHRKKDFKDLADDNATHFGPRAGGSDGKDHKAEWERVHRQALDIAQGATTVAEAQRALAYNAFAGHFLTDAFSAGHTVSKKDIMDRAKASFDKLETYSWPFTVNVFTGVAAEMLLRHPKAGPKLERYKLRLLGYGDMTADRLAVFLYGFADTHPEIFFETFIKLVHDELNKTGIEVDNARGDGPWTLPGDQYLATSRKTLEVGSAAMAASDANLRVAHATKGALDYPKLFAQVWAYTPHPTSAGQRHVDDVVAKYTDLAGNGKSLEAFVDFVANHIDAVIDELHSSKYNRLATQDELDAKAAENRKAADEWRRKAHIPIYRH